MGDRMVPSPLLSTDVAEVLDLLSDTCSQALLVVAINNPVTIADLDAPCEKSRRSIYCRNKTLRDQDLLEQVSPGVDLPLSTGQLFRTSPS